MKSHDLKLAARGVRGQGSRRILKGRSDRGFIFVVHCNCLPICHRLLSITGKRIFGIRFQLVKFNMAGIGVFGFLAEVLVTMRR